MPYSDPIKIKKHYETYRKPYMVKWKKENREYWNNYNKNWRFKKRADVAKNIISFVKEFNISEQGTKTFNAAVIYLFMNETGIAKPYFIHKRTEIDLLEVKFIIDNWTKNGLWCKKEKLFFKEDTNNDLELKIQFTMTCLVGAGKLVCVHY